MSASGKQGRVTVNLRQLLPEDEKEFLDFMRVSEKFHQPWAYPPRTKNEFKEYLISKTEPNNMGFLLCDENNNIAGVINLNNIVQGSFLSASLGYCLGEPFAGRGYMTTGLEMLIARAFTEYGLHRLEANIQPGNLKSIALVKSLGFLKEGYSPNFLKLNNIWQDHERWAILAY